MDGDKLINLLELLLIPANTLALAGRLGSCEEINRTAVNISGSYWIIYMNS